MPISLFAKALRHAPKASVVPMEGPSSGALGEAVVFLEHLRDLPNGRQSAKVMHRAIARTILDKKGEYVLALKGNQSALHSDAVLFVAEQKKRNFHECKISKHTSADGDHGRIETRATTVIDNLDWLPKDHAWPGLKALIVVDSTREIGDRVTRETRLYITSLQLPAEQLGAIVRSYWAIENSLHWVMDMVSRDDECRVRTEHAPANLTTIKHMAHNLLRQAPGKDSLPDPVRLSRDKKTLP